MLAGSDFWTEGSRVVLAVLALFAFAFVSAAGAAVAEPFRIEVDQTGGGAPGAGPRLCLVADESKPVSAPSGATNEPGAATPACAMASGTFFPVVLADYATAARAPADLDDDRHQRAGVKGHRLCLSHRTPAAFRPFVEPYLWALEADQAGSPLGISSPS